VYPLFTNTMLMIATAEAAERSPAVRRASAIREAAHSEEFQEWIAPEAAPAVLEARAALVERQE